MQWSKLRASVRALICPELRKRVDFHVTRYTPRSIRSRSGLVTIDGKKILELSYYRFVMQGDGWCAAAPSGRAFPGHLEWQWSPKQTDEIHPPQHLGDAMREYLDLPVKTALHSPNPFLRALAIIDRRIGRRTLESLKIGKHEHSLVKAFYALRMSTLSGEEIERTETQRPPEPGRPLF